jgi:hypothetical protein
LANPRVGDGRVFMIGREPIVDAMASSNQTRFLVLYGHPNRRYAIEYATNLMASAIWVPFEEVDLQSSRAVLAGLPASLPTIFYRAKEVGLIAPFGIQRAGDGLIIEWSETMGNCVLEESASLNTLSTWSSVSGIPQVAEGKYRVALSITAGNKFFRLRCVK